MSPTAILRDVSTSIRSAFRDARRESLDKWRAWVKETEANGKVPPPGALLDVGEALGIERPITAFENDVAAVHAVKKCEAAFDRHSQVNDRQLAPWGGSMKALREDIRALESQLKKLRKIEASQAIMHGVASVSRATEIKERHPVMFGEPAKVLAKLAKKLEPAA